MRLHRRRRPLRLESLEDRRLPATWGIPWADPQHLTVSFVPDGTAEQGGGSSQLFQSLDAQIGPSSGWEASILKALQSWAVNSNINIGVVADGGEPLGVAGPAQGDARFGDIRISAEPLPGDVVAITSPYSPAYGTTSGDIILNSNVDFKPGDPGSYDLFTIALHEAGHVFGFADSSDPSSFMYNVYQGPVSGLGSGAVPALQALYGGPRSIDSIDNFPFSTDPTHPVNIPNPPGNATSISLPGDLPSAQADDYFSFQAPNPINAPLGVDLTVQTAGISLLTPKVSVFTPTGQLVATASASGPLAGRASVHLAGLVQGQNYMVQVQGATGDVFSVGSYELTLGDSTLTSAPSNPTAGAQALQEPGNYTGSTPLTVGDLISGSNQVDVYSFKAPAFVPSGATISLQDWGFGLASPSFTVYTAANLAVGSASATNPGDPSAGLHLASVVPGATYFVRVQDGLLDPEAAGTYTLSVSFANPTGSGPAAWIPATPWYGQNNAANGPANATLNNAANLQTPAGEAPQSRYEAIDSVLPSQPLQFFKLQAPNAPNGQSRVMTISVQTLDTSGLLPWIGVFSQNGTPANEQWLTEEDGVAVVQVALASPGQQYVVEVSSAGGPSTSGNFFLDATFGSTLAAIGPIASGTLAVAPAGSATPSATASLSVGQGELDEFVLSGSASNVNTDAVLQMTLEDSSGDVVATLSTPAALASSLTACLPSGNYTIFIDAESPSGEAIPGLSYSLAETNLTDPIKAYAPSGSGGASNGK